MKNNMLLYFLNMHCFPINSLVNSFWLQYYLINLIITYSKRIWDSLLNFKNFLFLDFFHKDNLLKNQLIYRLFCFITKLDKKDPIYKQ